MRRSLLSIIFALLLALSACGAPAAPSSPDGETVTFTDALGRTVSVSEPKRVAAMIGSFADVWCAAGGKDTLVAAANDTWTQFDLGLGADVVDLGAVKEPSAETLLAAQPDFILASTKTQADVDLLPVFEQANIPVAYFDVSTFEDYLAMLKICTELTGRPDCYEENGEAVRGQVEKARERAEGREGTTVLYVRATGASCKVKSSTGTVLGEMLADLGCVNIADSDETLLETLSMEAILAADPEKIFFVLQGSDDADARRTLDETLLSNPAWQQLTAVRTGQVYYMDQTLYNLKPNARWGEAYEGLAEMLYGT